MWRSPASGTAYVKVVHRQPTYGPLNTYYSTLSANTTGLYDLYEPDDAGPAARDLPVDGSRQTHYFQANGDVDWVKFSIGSGQTAVSIAIRSGRASVRACKCRPVRENIGEPLAFGPTAQLDSDSGGLFYAQITNQAAGVYGPTAFYDVS